jgi:hypothetical protein
VRDEIDDDVALHERLRHLARDFGTLPLIRGRKGFVEKHHGARAEFPGDGAHPAQLLVQLAMPHRGVFLALVMGMQRAAHGPGVSRGRHEHAALHHELG